MTDSYEHDLSAVNEGDESEPVIDWEARCGTMFRENIRQAERYKGKIRKQGERIQELERINATQAKSIQTMRPANEKRKAAEKLLEDSQAAWAARYNEQDKVISELTATIAKGKRGTLEMAIAELQAEANRMARIEGKA